jgi:hypothetical protein
MTQQTIDFQPAERLSLCDKLEAYFRDRPHRWLTAQMLMQVAGQMAWRTRVSDLRKRGMDIENRTRRVSIHADGCPSNVLNYAPCSCSRRSFTVSEYRYVPEGQ